jgi:hypothetical protein
MGHCDAIVIIIIICIDTYDVKASVTNARIINVVMYAMNREREKRRIKVVSKRNIIYRV